MNKKTIRDIDIAGKRVFVRVDFNVPLDEQIGSQMMHALWLLCPQSNICLTTGLPLF